MGRGLIHLEVRVRAWVFVAFRVGYIVLVCIVLLVGVFQLVV